MKFKDIDEAIRLSNSTPERVAVALSVDGRNVIVLRQASESGQLFGSVSV